MGEAGLQDRYAPNGTCFGCGPRNEKGLRVKSHVRGDDIVATWRAEKFHEAFDGVLSGGIIGTLMDCYTIKMRRPTPTDGEIHIVARAVDVSDDRATVEAELRAGGKVCATSSGVFVAVKPGHPAYHRW